MTSSKTYVIAWEGAIDNCVDISRQLLEGNVSHVFYNVSSLENQSSHWQTTDDVRYYNHFFRAIEDFLSTENDVFIFNSGDIQYADYAGLTAGIENLFDENDGLAVFAPDATNNIYSGWGSLVEDSSKYNHMYLSTNTDGLYVSMSREMATYMSNFHSWSVTTKQIDFSKMTSGWGLDHIYCSLAIYLNKIIYRDRSVVVHHPVGQSYSEEVAVREFYQIMQSFLKFSEEILEFDSSRLRHIINQTLGKIKDNNREPLGKEAVYTDLEAVRDA